MWVDQTWRDKPTADSNSENEKTTTQRNYVNNDDDDTFGFCCFFFVAVVVYVINWPVPQDSFESRQPSCITMVFFSILSAVFNVPVLIALLSIVFFASIGISLGVRRAYIKVLLKIFEVRVIWCVCVVFVLKNFFVNIMNAVQNICFFFVECENKRNINNANGTNRKDMIVARIFFYENELSCLNFSLLSFMRKTSGRKPSVLRPNM